MYLHICICDKILRQRDVFLHLLCMYMYIGHIFEHMTYIYIERGRLIYIYMHNERDKRNERGNGTFPSGLYMYMYMNIRI